MLASQILAARSKDDQVHGQSNGMAFVDGIIHNSKLKYRESIQSDNEGNSRQQLISSCVCTVLESNLKQLIRLLLRQYGIGRNLLCMLHMNMPYDPELSRC